MQKTFPLSVESHARAPEQATGRRWRTLLFPLSNLVVMSEQRLNVLLIVTDQQQASALGSVDDTFETPNVDRLAEEGTQFTGCHATCPQCSPSRSSLFTGQYPHQNGMYTLAEWGPGPLDTEAPSVARAFRDAGHRTAYIGKWHLGETGPGVYGWETTANVHETSNPPEGFRTDERTRDRAVSYLSTYDESKPFFLTVSFNLPHPPFMEDEGFTDRFDRADVPIPVSFSDDLSEKPAFQRLRATGSEGNLDAADVRDIGYKYRTMTARVDDHVGRLLETLETEGLADETVVVFTSDHGDMQGAHRLNKKGVIAYDEILRVPLVMRLPNRRSTRDRIPDLVSNRAIPATLLDAAGVDAPDAFKSGSVLEALGRRSPPDDDRVFFEHKYAYWGEHPYRGVRTTRWKFVEYLRDETNELYDLRDDPHEMRNLATDPAFTGTMDRLQQSVRAWWDETDGDDDQWLEPVT